MPYWFLILWFDKRNPAYYANGQNTTTNLHFPNHIARILRIIARWRWKFISCRKPIDNSFAFEYFPNKISKMISRASSRNIIGFKIRVTNLSIANESRFSRRVIVSILPRYSFRNIYREFLSTSFHRPIYGDNNAINYFYRKNNSKEFLEWWNYLLKQKKNKFAGTLRIGRYQFRTFRVHLRILIKLCPSELCFQVWSCKAKNFFFLIELQL